MSFSFGTPTTPQQNKSTFSFGGNATAGQPTNSFTLGQKAQPAFTGGSSFSFGGKSAGGAASGQTPSLFGATTGQTTTSSFGSFGGNAGGGSAFGGGAFGGSAFGGGGQQQSMLGQQSGQLGVAQTQLATATQPPPPPGPLETLSSLGESFNAASPHCRLVTILYNRVEKPAEYAAGGGGGGPDDRSVSGVLWDQALRHTEAGRRSRSGSDTARGSSKLVPVEARGFGDLERREAAQVAAIGEHKAALEAAESALALLRRRHDLGASAKLEEARREQRALEARLLNLMGKLDALRGPATPVAGDEAALADALRSVQDQLDRPDQHKARLAELVSLVRMSDATPGAPAPSLAADASAALALHLEEAAKGVSLLAQQARLAEREVSLLLAGLRDVA